jgi:hypothetical protein
MAAAVVSLGALGIAGPVAASSAATVPVTAGANLVSTNNNAALAAWTNGAQAARAGLAAGAQAAVGGWQVGTQAGINGWLTGTQAAQAGIAAGAHGLLPVVP